MIDDICMMTCDWCGKEFPADARACVEAGIQAFDLYQDGDEWKGDDAISIDPKTLSQDQIEFLKQSMGLDDAQLHELLTTGKIESLGAIVCLECQDNPQKTVAQP